MILMKDRKELPVVRPRKYRYARNHVKFIGN